MLVIQKYFNKHMQSSRNIQELDIYACLILFFSVALIQITLAVLQGFSNRASESETDRKKLQYKSRLSLPNNPNWDWSFYCKVMR